MSDEEDLDPEMWADMQKRRESEFDHTRTRQPAKLSLVRVVPDYEHVEPAVIETCSHGHHYAVAIWKQCPVCQGMDNRALTVRLANAIRTIKSSSRPREEKQAIRECQECRHSDLEGLLKAVEDRLANKSGKRAARGSL